MVETLQKDAIEKEDRQQPVYMGYLPVIIALLEGEHSGWV